MTSSDRLLAWAAEIIEGQDVHCPACLQEHHDPAKCNNSMGCEGCGYCTERNCDDLWSGAAWLKEWRAWRDEKVALSDCCGAPKQEDYRFYHHGSEVYKISFLACSKCGGQVGPATSRVWFGEKGGSR